MPMLHPEERDESDMPNLAALDAELTARIRRLVYAEVESLIDAKVEEKWQQHFPAWLKEPDVPPAASSLASIVNSLPPWARKDE